MKSQQNNKKYDVYDVQNSGNISYEPHHEVLLNMSESINNLIQKIISKYDKKIFCRVMNEIFSEK